MGRVDVLRRLALLLTLCSLAVTAQPSQDDFIALEIDILPTEVDVLSDVESVRVTVRNPSNSPFAADVTLRVTVDGPIEDESAP